MSFKDRYSFDRAAVEEGTWVDLGGGLSVKVRRMDSAHSKAVRRKLEAPFSALLRSGQELAEETQEELLVDQFSQSIIIDWKGVTDDAGNELPATPENIKKTLKAYPEFRDDVARVVTTRDTFRTQKRELDAGN